MLTIHVVRQGGQLYYVDDLVPGRAEGTLVAGEAPGTWSGAGASALRVTGTVEAEAFAEVLDGRDPWSGAALRAARGDRSVAGYDLTFCAPKSVSLLHLLAPGEMAGEVGCGHQVAVMEAAAYLERAAAGVRRARRGHTSYLRSNGVVAAGFHHRTSRALDPHLHTHLVVANVAQGVDGRWSALDGRRLFAHAPAARAIYHARLRMELSHRLGARWEVSPSGLGDVIGVEATMRRLFSQRSAAIDEYMVRRTVPTSARTRGAFHATRPDKDRTRTVESLTAEWKQRAVDHGFDVGELTRVVGPRPELRPGSAIDGGRVHDQLGRLASPTRTLARRDLVAVIAAASTSGVDARVVEAVADHVVEVTGLPAAGHGLSCGGTAADRSDRWSAHEPRWVASDVARALARESDALLAPPTHRSVLPGLAGLLPRHVDVPALARVRVAGVERSTAAPDVQLGR